MVVSVEQSLGEKTVSQKSYNLDLLSSFGKSDCNHCDFYLTANTRIDRSLCPVFQSDAFKDLSKIGSFYMFLVGKLNYFSAVSRPVLIFVVSFSTQVFMKPSHDLAFS